MQLLTLTDIKVETHLSDKADVIAALASWLITEGCVSPGYDASMLAREAVASTYLGQGVALPHGMRDNAHLVQRSAIKVMLLPNGVRWQQHEKAYLVIAIVADSEQHLPILTQLTTLLNQGDIKSRLKQLTTPTAVLQFLQGTTPLPSAPQASQVAMQPKMVTQAKIATQLKVSSLGQLNKQASRLLSLTQAQHSLLAQLPPVAIGQGWWLAELPDAHHTQAGILTLAPDGAGIAQLPDIVGLVVLIGEQHKSLLDQLTTWLSAGKGAELAATENAQLLEQRLQQGPTTFPLYKKTAVILNPHGLHARPAALLVQAAKRFSAEIRASNLDGDGHWVCAKSLMAVLSLGVKSGHKMLFSAQGEDACAALNGIIKTIAEGLGETLPCSELAGSELSVPVERVAIHNQELQGVAAASGVVIGPLFVDAPLVFEYPQWASDSEAEMAALTAAIHQATGLLSQMKSSHPQAQSLLEMQRELLADPSLCFGAQCRIKQGQSAAAAWWAEIEAAAFRQQANQDKLLAERALDIRDIGRRVMAILCHTCLASPPSEPYIWVAEEIGPSQLLDLDPAQVLGWVTVGGGAASHSAILARALGIPAVVAMDEQVMSLASGTQAILNGDKGALWVAPQPSILQQAEEQQRLADKLAEQAWSQRHQEAITQDGYKFAVRANVAEAEHLDSVLASGAAGVGLLRTEFVFMSRAQAPDLAEQTVLYKRLFAALKGQPLLVRTLDVGGDKPLPYGLTLKEDNPFLGVRGTRLYQYHPEWLDVQLEALLTAAADRPVRIMFPMITELEEWRWVKQRFEKVRSQFKHSQVELGIMVEVPAVALNAAAFAEEVDFFSIGTNDLTQYTLAIDRGNGELAHLSDGLSPAVLRLIQMTTTAAHAKGKWVGLCGELGADLQALPVLLGLGIDEVSVSIRQVPLVKSQIRACYLSHCQALAAQALLAPDASSVRELVATYQVT